MAARKVKNNVLGRGISALISESAPIKAPEEIAADPENTVQYIDINDIRPNRNQPRKNFDSDSISELAASIQEHGIIQPLIVRKNESGYELVAGERRWRAAREAALDKVPCIIRELSDRENMLLAIVENMQREDLNPIEEAEGLKTMINTYSLTQDEVSRSVGKSRPYIANAMRLLNLEPEVVEMVRSGAISAGHGRTLLACEDAKKQVELAARCAREGLSVRALEDIVSGKKTRKKTKKPEKDPNVESLENELKEKFGTKVNLVRKGAKGNRGAIEIEFYSEDELERLLEMLRD